MKLLALYYREEKKFNAKKRKEELYKFCQAHMECFNRALHYKMINKALEYASKQSNRLTVVEAINITQGEVQYINSLDISAEYKKCMFAFLVQMRLNKAVYEQKNGKEYTGTYFKGGSQKYALIKKMANVSQKLNINNGFVREMSELGYISVLHNGLIDLTFLKDCIPHGDMVIEVKDYANVGFYLDYFNGVKGVVLCNQCGQPFKQTKHDILYCSVHKEYYVPIGTKTVKCVDCGVEFEVDAKDNWSDRCKAHRKKRDKENARMRKRKQRNVTLSI